MKNTFFKLVSLILIAIAIPFVLNSLILLPSIWPIVGGQNADVIWLSFWATYLGAVASFAMVYWTWRTLKQNKEQLDEMKRQWDAEHTPVIDIIPVYLVSESLVVLEVRNISRSYAKNIQFRIDPQYIDQIPCLSNRKNGLKNFYNTICEHPFSLLPNERKYFYLISKDISLPEDCTFVSLWNELYLKDQYETIFNYLRTNPFTIDCKYNHSLKKSFTIDIKDAFLGDIQIPSPSLKSSRSN